MTAVMFGLLVGGGALFYGWDLAGSWNIGRWWVYPAALVAAAIGFVLTLRETRPFLWGDLVAELWEHGKFVCLLCGYMRPDAATACPECGACDVYGPNGERWVAHPDSMAEPPPDWLLQATYRGVTPPADLSWRIMMPVFSKDPEREQTNESLRTAAAVILFFGGIYLGVYVHWAPAIALWVCALPGWWMVARWRAQVYLNRRIPVARKMYRQSGVELCMPCGRYLGDEGAEVEACPECKAPREPMPTLQPDADPA